jgi:dihydrofolate synthase/folylpolyglutamate synthase
MSLQTLSEWTNYLEKLPAIQSSPAEKFALTEIVFKRLGLEDFSPFTVIVTGTNGKGSCVAALDSLCRTVGLSTAALTSPHLVKINERVLFNGRPVTDEQLIDAFITVENARDELPINYFQFLYLAGIYLIKRLNPQVALLEVGLGGRFDVTNHVENQVAVITNIALDHCELLGDTRELIAKEKSGIIKKGSVAVIGDNDPPITIAEQITQQGVESFFVGKDFSFSQQADGAWSWRSGQRELMALPESHLLNCNLSTALKAFEVLSEQLDLPMRYEQIQQAINNVRLFGRCQLVINHCQWLLDVSHNLQAVEHLVKFAQEKAAEGGRIHALFSVKANREAKPLIKPLINLVDKWHFVDMENQWMQPAEQLQLSLRQLGISCYDSHANFEQAYNWFTQSMQPNDLVIVYGSFITVGEMLKQLGESAWNPA